MRPRSSDVKEYASAFLKQLLDAGDLTILPFTARETPLPDSGADIPNVTFGGITMKNVHIWQSFWRDGLHEVRLDCVYPWTIGPRVQRTVKWSAWLYNMPAGQHYWKLDGHNIWVSVYGLPPGITKILKEWKLLSGQPSGAPEA